MYIHEINVCKTTHESTMNGGFLELASETRNETSLEII